MKNITIYVVAALLVSAAVINSSQAKIDVIEKSFEVKQGGTLYLDADAGSIEIESHNRDTVKVTTEKDGRNADKFHVEFAQQGDDVKVSAEQNGSYFGGGARVRFIIQVPQKYNVDLHTGGGSIKLSDLNGKVEANTSGGSIALGHIEGDVDIKTSGGSIRVEDVAGNINAHTSGGSIKATISKQPDKDCRLTTSGGSITAYLAPSIALDLVASTSSGSVHSEFDIEGSIKKYQIKGQINGGGPELTLKTSGGGVRVKKL